MLSVQLCFPERVFLNFLFFSHIADLKNFQINFTFFYYNALFLSKKKLKFAYKNDNQWYQKAKKGVQITLFIKEFKIDLKSRIDLNPIEQLSKGFY